MSALAAAPRFSVVVPAYNEADYLPATLRSLQQQDFAGSYEVIVVDNNSTDDTAAVAARHGVRVMYEPQQGVCAARQLGTSRAVGEIVVSTDADTVHPVDWLTRLDARFRSADDVVAVAGPCRYRKSALWAKALPHLAFGAIALAERSTGRVLYVTATNVAFVRAIFPGYDTTLTQGGDEADLLRRLRRLGRVVWDADNAVLTSSRRLDQGLAYTVFVSYGYYYAGTYLRSRFLGSQQQVAPAIRRADLPAVHRRRRTTRAVVVLAVLAIGATRWRHGARVGRTRGGGAIR